ncbi:hypothetical protein FIV00_26035 [Labrenzia sp. THAF82]|uniref:hypothetical protein n=1 Tax=Labrenzia sp. THAF82 TaxID=2587861 RepID=UPI001269079A|nr:hypothetical protein [Labrenzia sp. THAF82]QFT33983.1 hypothetical protein FIV00_26035 [Labrenzia sp. THAF82]
MSYQMERIILRSLIPPGFFGLGSQKVRTVTAHRSPKKSLCQDKFVSLNGSVRSVSKSRVSSLLEFLRSGNWRNFFSVSGATQAGSQGMRVSVTSRKSTLSALSEEEKRTGNFTKAAVDRSDLAEDAKNTLNWLLGHTIRDGKVLPASSPKALVERYTTKEETSSALPECKAAAPVVSREETIEKPVEADQVAKPAILKNQAEERARLEKDRTEKFKALLSGGTTDAIARFNDLNQKVKDEDKKTIEILKHHGSIMREIKAQKAEAQFLDFIDSKDFDDYKNSLSPTKSNYEYKAERLEILAADKENKISKTIYIWEKRAQLGFGNQLS